MRSSNSDRFEGNTGCHKSLRLLAVLLLGWWLLLSNAAIALTATASPATCSNVTGIGTQDWLTSVQAVSSGNNYATASVNDNQTTRYLQCTGYNFAIPVGATINGITVNVERKSSDTITRDAAMLLMKAGAITGTDRSTATNYTTLDIIEAHGGATDLWGTTWSPAEINNANFGAAFAAQKAGATGGARTVSVDHVQIIVDYSVPSATVINTYYPATASVVAGATTITLGASSGAATPISAGDLVLIMQMQDATINANNDDGYGDGTTGDLVGKGATSVGKSGLYEYAVASGLSGNTLTLTCGTSNAYTSGGQSRFQVIRVPVYTNYTLGLITAQAWNGSTGGVLAFDVTGVLTLNSATVSVDGMGFRGGAARASTTGSGAYTDYRTPVANLANGTKGEGIAGTPYYVFTAPSTLTNTGVDGYPNGSFARGAPGNAGGGGTDRHPAANDENPGGGGGANGGAGGIGGIGWCGAFTTTAPYYGCGYAALASATNPAGSTGGFGGAPVSSIGAARLTLGGGGGSGTTNNSTGSLGALSTSGAAGGGIVMIRAGSMTGSAIFNANGSDADSTIRNDGSGGGGAGGLVLINTASGMGSVTINVKGGIGGSNLVPPGSISTPHGPGGGGGGGYAITSAAPAACNNGGGANGVTYNNGVLFGAYGAMPGSSGSCTATLTAGQIPGAAIGPVSPCSAISHYAISPNGNGVTCQPEAVTITPHSAVHAALTASNTTTISLSATLGPGNGGAAAKGNWTAPSGTLGTFTAGAADSGTATYTFPSAGASGVTLYYQNTWGQTVNFNVSDGTATERSGTASADTPYDPDMSWTTAGFRFVDASNAAIGAQTAGVPSGTYYLQPVQSSCATAGAPCAGVCADLTKSGPFANGTTTNIDLAYACTDPATCSCTSAPATCVSNSLPTLTVTNNASNYYVQGNSGSVSGYILVPLTFATAPAGICSGATPCAAAPFTFNFTDVGEITLNARYNVAPGGGGAGTSVGNPLPMTGVSAPFVVKPYDFSIIPCTSATPCLIAPADPGLVGGGGVFIKAGNPFNATITARAFGGTTTPNFGLGTAKGTEAVTLTRTLQAPVGGSSGTLTGTGATTPLYRSSFINGVVSVSDLAWDEVGVITLMATNSNFLGQVLATTGTSGNVGRFIPDHFGLTGSVVTRSDLQAGEGQAVPFTYMDEPMKLTLLVTAYGTGDGVTQNYVGNFAKLDAATMGTGGDWFNTGCAASTQCMGLGAVDGTTGLSGRLAIIGAGAYAGVGAPTSSWAAGVGTFAAHVKLNRNSTPDGPYQLLKFGAMPRDSEGVTLPGAASADPHKVNLDATTGNTLASNPDGTNERKLLFTTDVRFGRLWMGNAYGPEQRDLVIPFEVQYWNGNTFIKNTADSLTSIAKANIGLGNHQPSGFSSSVDLTHVPAGPFLVTSGSGSLTLLKPSGSPLSGSVDVVFDLGTTVTTNTSWVPSQPPTVGANMGYLRGKWSGTVYDRDPTSRGTFGIFGSSLKKGPIYLRENY